MKNFLKGEKKKKKRSLFQSPPKKKKSFSDTYDLDHRQIQGY